MPHKILVVEDDPQIMGFARTVLENAGFEVAACGTMAEAGRLLRAAEPDLAIVDIGLPDGSGIDLCRASQELGLPFVFLTARGDLPSRLEAFGSGAQDYIQKPFAVEELLARVKVHLRVKKSHDDLAKRNYDLELINRARQDMADMIIHDLKAPLASITGTIEIIKLRGLIKENDYRVLVDTAGTAADFMLLMLNDLLDIGRAEHQGLKVEPEAVELAPLLERLQALFAGRLRARKQTLRLLTGVETVTTDRNLVFRVLVNFISNALKHSPMGQEIVVVADREPDGVRLSVSDRGPGVPDAAKQRIFEKYTTSAGADHSPEGGTGLGLTFCRLAAYALRARIDVRDRPGGGSVFSLLLPA